MQIRRILFWTDFNEHVEQHFDTLAGRIRQILNPTGLSDFAKVALHQACQLTAKFDAELHLLYVVHNLFHLVADVSAKLAVGPNEIRATVTRAEQLLDKTVEASEFPTSRPVVRKVCVGQVSGEVTSYVVQNHIDLLVLGAHGYTAEKIIRTAGCPVWTVPTKQSRAAVTAQRDSARS